MALVYEGYFTNSAGSNPHKFRMGFPIGGSGSVAQGWGNGPHGANLNYLNAALQQRYASTSQVPPTLDMSCTLICRYTSTPSGSTVNGLAEILAKAITNSAFSLVTGETKIFWFCKQPGLINNPNTRNIVFERLSNGNTRWTFRIGIIQYGYSSTTGDICIVPWIYPNISTGLVGGVEFYSYASYPAGSEWCISMPNGMGIPSYNAAAYNSSFRTWVEGLPQPADPDNPFDPGGTSQPGDGEPGNFSDESDDVEEDTMPTISAVGTGMATIFTPTTTQLKNLSDIFWGASWWQALQNTVEGIDKMFVSLGIVPFQVTAGSTVEVTWLGLSLTEVMLTLAAAQYYEFDMGTINMGNDDRIFTSGSALDYSPFSKLGIYLPFIGYQELDIDEFRGASVNLKYRIDILSGTCVALVKINGNTIYQFTGNCMTQIPITSQSFETMITNAVNVGIAISGVRSASAVGAAAGDVAAAQFDADKISPEQAQLTLSKSRAHVEGGVDRLLSACANSIMGLKPNYDKSGAVSNSASLLAVKQPFLFLTTPRQCIPDHYQRYSGFPSNITRKIGECSGFLVVESIRLNGLVATSKEVEEIYDLLKSGVIV